MLFVGAIISLLIVLIFELNDKYDAAEFLIRNLSNLAPDEATPAFLGTLIVSFSFGTVTGKLLCKLQNYKLLLAFGTIILCLVGGFAMGTYFAVNINRTLNHKKALMVPKTRQLHKQLQYALIIQSLGPLIAGTCPAISLFLLSFTNAENPTFCMLLSMCFSLISIVKPSAAIIFIKPYRALLIKIFFKKVWKSNPTSTMEEGQSRPRPQTNI